MENPFKSSVHYYLGTRQGVIERREKICEIMANNPKLSKRKIRESLGEKYALTIKKATVERDLTILRTARAFLDGELTLEAVEKKRKVKYWIRIFASGVDFLIKDQAEDESRDTSGDRPKPKAKSKFKKEGKIEELKNPTTFGLEEAIEVFKGIVGDLFQRGVENSALKEQIRALEEKFLKLEEAYKILFEAHNKLVKDLGDNFIVSKRKK